MIYAILYLFAVVQLIRISWRFFAKVKSSGLRVFLRTGVISLLTAPVGCGGHGGCVILPLVVLFFLADNFINLLKNLPLLLLVWLGYWLIYFLIGLYFVRFNEDRAPEGTDWISQRNNERRRRKSTDET